MVREEKSKGDSHYFCQICGMAYEEEEWAVRCEEWCREHQGSCNLDIIEHAVNNKTKGCC